MTTRPAAEQPTVYVIAGPNGAGKTTFATEFLPQVMDRPEFLNADLIAAGLSPLAPQTQALRAGRLLLERFDELAGLKRDFGFETTLSGKSYAPRIDELKRGGYRVVIVFLWLPNADLAVARVANRVRQGGHSVPEVDIRRRFGSSISNFMAIYRRMSEACWIYNASHIPARLIAEDLNGTSRIVDDASLQLMQASVRQ